MERDFPRIERYEGLRQRVRELVDRVFHHNRVPATDLDALEAAVDRLDALVRVEPGAEVALAAAVAAAPVPAPKLRPKPPVAKKGRKRGFRPSAEREAMKAAAAAAACSAAPAATAADAG